MSTHGVFRGAKRGSQTSLSFTKTPLGARPFAIKVSKFVIGGCTAQQNNVGSMRYIESVEVDEIDGFSGSALDAWIAHFADCMCNGTLSKCYLS